VSKFSDASDDPVPDAEAVSGYATSHEGCESSESCRRLMGEAHAKFGMSGARAEAEKVKS